MVKLMLSKIELESAVCKTNVLTTVLPLWPPGVFLKEHLVNVNLNTSQESQRNGEDVTQKNKRASTPLIASMGKFQRDSYSPMKLFPFTLCSPKSLIPG